MIERLWISHFRNISEALWAFNGEKKIGIYGDNGNGKSNFLEAIYFLINGKSFRGCPVEDMCPFENKKFSMGMDISGSRVYVAWDGKKSVQVSGKDSTLSALKTRVQVSYFSSDIVRLLTESPDARRRELDRFCKRYFEDSMPVYVRHEALLRQKNQALKQQNITLARLFHEQLSEVAGNLVSFRERALDIISERIMAYASFFPSIQNLDKIQLDYVFLDEGAGKIDHDRASYVYRMKQYFETHAMSEMTAGFSLYGPHREDFTVLLEGRPMSRFYSRGVNKISAILFRLATYELMKLKVGLPILLFDDVFAEVDSHNQHGIFHILEAFPQVFFTAILRETGFLYRDTDWYQIQHGKMEKK